MNNVTWKRHSTEIISICCNHDGNVLNNTNVVHKLSRYMLDSTIFRVAPSTTDKVHTHKKHTQTGGCTWEKSGTSFANDFRSWGLSGRQYRESQMKGNIQIVRIIIFRDKIHLRNLHLMSLHPCAHPLQVDPDITICITRKIPKSSQFICSCWIASS